ncbi:MAG: hypothetical protein D6795_10310 [Deltaproteobacteria bacterium]|nr:MAG: hypothetical protein D6795_10310 [Deltaproteobacteria bacterium]
MKPILSFVSSLFLLLAFNGCGGGETSTLSTGGTEGGGGSSSALPATFSEVQSKIFVSSCAFSQCHGQGSRQGGLNLDPAEGDVYAEIVGVPSTEVPDLNRIEPGSPQESYLYLKLIDDPAITGALMPLTGGPLDADRLESIRSWIESGAQND